MEVLAPGRRQEVAADLIDVEVELADRLARIDQVRHAGRSGERTDLRGRIHESAIGRHVGERHQRDIAADNASAIAATDTCPDSSLGTRSIDHARGLRGSDERDRVRAVFVIVDEDPLTLLIGTDQNAAFHAAVAFSKRAISRGPAPIRRAIDVYTAASRSADSRRCLVATLQRFTLEVIESGPPAPPRVATSTRRGSGGRAQFRAATRGRGPAHRRSRRRSTAMKPGPAASPAGAPSRDLVQRFEEGVLDDLGQRRMDVEHTTSDVGASWSNSIAWTIGWISDAACCPMMWAPMIKPVSVFTSTLANDVVSTSAQPYAVPAYSRMPTTNGSPWSSPPLGQADRGHLRTREHRARHGLVTLVVEVVGVGDVPERDLGLGVRQMLELVRVGDVADRPDPVDVRRHRVVDLDRAMLADVDAAGLGVEQIAVRLAAGGHQQFVDHDRLSPHVISMPSATRAPTSVLPEMQVDTLAEHLGEPLGDLLVESTQHPSERANSVTSDPSAEKTWPISAAMNPPPMMPSRSGSSASRMIESDVWNPVSTRPSIGGIVGREPAAISTCGA